MGAAAHRVARESFPRGDFIRWGLAQTARSSSVFRPNSAKLSTVIRNYDDVLFELTIGMNLLFSSARGGADYAQRQPIRH
jgi:hypothetical protein